MATMAKIKKELFEELDMGGFKKEMLEFTKLSDEILLSTIGMAARETRDTLKPGTEYLRNPNMGDTEGKSALFFRNPKTASTGPCMYLELPNDDLEAGRVAYGQMEGCFDRVICETVRQSPLYGYKQEVLKLAVRCVEAIEERFPSVDPRIVKAYVALRAKGEFGTCTRW